MSGDKTIKVISVQDISCFGSCSQSVSHAILSARGIETAMLPTAILSAHTAFSGVTCLDLTDEMEKIIAHWKRENLKFDAVLSGYVSSIRQISAIRSLGDLLQDGGKWIVDPAMADHGRMYQGLGPDILAGMKELVRRAHVILPNMTEAALLLDRPYEEAPSPETIREILRGLTAMGPRVAVITGTSGPDDQIGAAAYDREEDRFAYGLVKRLPKSYPGTGDIFAAVFSSCYVKALPLERCLQEACDFVEACILETLSDDTHAYGVKFEQVLARKLYK